MLKGSVMITNKLSVCILGKGNTEYLPKCIEYASKISREVLYIDLESDNQSKSKAREPGASVVDLDSFPSSLQTEWVLFLRPYEKPVIRSGANLPELLARRDIDGYTVFVKSIMDSSLLQPYQWVRNLEQFKNFDNSAYISRLEMRLVRHEHAAMGLDIISGRSLERIAGFRSQIIDDLAIEPYQAKKREISVRVKEHDLRCLKGELTYGPAEEDNMIELTEGLISFRVLHMGYLDSFMEGARVGFGNDKMYLSMLHYLGKEGHFTEAKDLFETWISKRDGKEKSDIFMMGGFIYGNLLDPDNAIACYRKAIELDQTSLALSSMGKLYLVKGEKEKALSYLKKAVELQPDRINEQIVSIISEEDWKMKSLSLCMIAKDEEETIQLALESVKDIVDEVIVVDTGSSDKTREIVREFGGKVIEAEWQDDFSAARNLALKEANGNYMLCLDADEFIDPRERFGLLLAKGLLPPARETRAYRIKVEPDKDAVGLSVSYLSRLEGREPVNYQIRIFSTGMGIQFNGTAFENIDESLHHLGIEATGNDMFKITHSKPNGKVRDQRKIPAVLKCFKSDSDPAKALEGGLFFLRLGDIDQAYPWLEKTEKVEPALSAKIARLYSMKNQHERAKKIIKKGLEYSPESSDLILALAGVCHKEGQYNKVRELLSDRIDVVRKDLDPEAAAEASYYYGIALLETDLLAEGIEHIAYSSENNPLETRYMMGSIYAFSKAGQWEDAIELAGRIVDKEGIEIDREVNDFADVALVFMELSKHFGQAGQVDEESMCRKIIEIILHAQSLKKEEMEKMSRLLESEKERADG